MCVHSGCSKQSKMEDDSPVIYGLEFNVSFTVFSTDLSFYFTLLTRITIHLAIRAPQSENINPIVCENDSKRN